MAETHPNEISENELRRILELEAGHAIDMFKHFYFQTLIAPLQEITALTQISVDTASTKLPEPLRQAGCHFKGFVFDFSDDMGVEEFLRAYRENARHWEKLDAGFLDAREYFNLTRERKEYPIFAIVNPLGIAYDDRTQEELGLKGFGRAFRNVTKYGRVHLAVTPDHLQNTGTNWPDVPKSYTEALVRPDQAKLKLPLCAYLLSRQIIQKYGFQQRCEDPYGVFTPQIPVLQQAIQTERDLLKPTP